MTLTLKGGWCGAVNHGDEGGGSGNGRNQHSTSEAINAYYAASLMGVAYGHTHFLAIGSTLIALEILSGKNVVAYERGSAVW